MITKTLLTAETNNAVASEKSFERFTTCSVIFNPRAIKGGNGDEEGGDGIVVQDDIVN